MNSLNTIKWKNYGIKSALIIGLWSMIASHANTCPTNAVNDCKEVPAGMACTNYFVDKQYYRGVWNRGRCNGALYRGVQCAGNVGACAPTGGPCH